MRQKDDGSNASQDVRRQGGAGTRDGGLTLNIPYFPTNLICFPLALFLRFVAPLLSVYLIAILNLFCYPFTVLSITFASILPEKETLSPPQ